MGTFGGGCTAKARVGSGYVGTGTAGSKTTSGARMGGRWEDWGGG